MIKGSFFILLFYLLGEMISLLLNGFIPGSVIGMVLLFLSLLLKIVRPEWVKNTATVITRNMAVFFVPAAVGLVAYVELLSNSLVTIFSAIIISTILTIIAVGLVQQALEKKIGAKKK
ncbi:MAG: CidA/LrgA family protein [Paludibacter sp.]|nr:CidA/LrgA family protein [Paludibacter sp.]MDD4429057.1 CidA/LrgA family protein [Paludibacter sp.]